MQAFARPLSGGRLAVLLLNRAPAAARLSTSWAELGIAAGRRAAVYDVLTHASRGAVAGSFQADVPSHDVAFVILQPEAGAPPLHTESNVVMMVEEPSGRSRERLWAAAYCVGRLALFRPVLDQ